MTSTSSPVVAFPLGARTAEDGEVWTRLGFALGQTRIAVAVWDASDRLAYANARFEELFPHLGPFDDKPHFQTLRDRARRFFAHDPVISESLDERFRRRTDSIADGEFLESHNRVIRYHDIRTPDGGIVTVYEDITHERSVEASLTALAKTIPGAIFELRRTPDGQVTCPYVSDRILELTGLEPTEFTRDWYGALARLAADGECRRLDEALTASAETLDEWRMEVPIRGTDKSLRWLKAQATARRLSDGTVVWSGMLTDTTQSVESTAALADSERRFRDIIDIASDWVWETDAAGRVTFLSERFVETAGLPTEEIIGRVRATLPVFDLNDPGYQAIDEDVRARRPIHARRLRLITPDGDRQISLRGRPKFDDAGTFLGYRGTGTDVTREHEYVQRLHDAMLEAQSANRAKSRFLANMSHDLRTPLNAIMGFSEIMQAEVFGPVGHPRYAEYIRDVRTSAVHLLELIDDLLDLARIESGRVEMVKERLVVSELVDEAIMLVLPRCEARGVALTQTCSVATPVVRSDRRAIKQILVNLLTNASKFTERGGKIDVLVDLDDIDGIWVTVRDDGCGIPAAMIEEVTKPFVQASDPTTRPRDGVGLGLAIVRSLTEAIGADFHIESRQGEGTTVAFRLPSGLPPSA